MHKMDVSLTMTLLLFGIEIGTLYLYLLYFSVALDPLEPPFVNSTLPVLGRALGLVRHGQPYWKQAE